MRMRSRLDAYSRIYESWTATTRMSCHVSKSSCDRTHSIFVCSDQVRSVIANEVSISPKLMDESDTSTNLGISSTTPVMDTISKTSLGRSDISPLRMSNVRSTGDICRKL